MFLAMDAHAQDAGVLAATAMPQASTAAAATASVGIGDEPQRTDEAEPAVDPPPFAGDVELKRQNTDRASPEESTKTTLRLERYYYSGALSLLRLDVPFPDDKTDFGGSPFDPRLGDVKVRLGFRPFRATGSPFSAFVELTAPTGDTPTFGSGKWQITPGVETDIALDAPRGEAWTPNLHVLAEQDVAFAGEAAAKDIDYTKFELGAEAHWHDGRLLKLTLKPVIDWVQDGRTGAVLELEGGMKLSPTWIATLMLGRALWNGGDVAGTYGTRVELTIKYKY